jgi:hypothetical protein
MQTTKAAELDRIIENLQAELDACPNRLWNSEGNQYRLDQLIILTAKRAALAY